MTHIKPIKPCFSWTSRAAHAIPLRGKLGCLGVLRVKVAGRFPQPKPGERRVKSRARQLAFRDTSSWRIHMLFPLEATPALAYQRGRAIRRSPAGARSHDVWKSPLVHGYLGPNLCYRS